ncbi:MAG TPA: RNase adapter RapZ [Bacillales bacterium]|nr:RNase adapter RapZ [Bacillales bacterium]
MAKEIQIVIITGMSGAGKTVAMQSFEDLGFFCIDNLPPTLLSKFVELVKESADKTNKIALVMDLRGREFFESLFEAIDQFSENADITPQILFLDAKDSVLVRRYKETRRSHPLAPKGSPLGGIGQEREMLSEMKGKAQHYIDTTDLKPRELREKIIQRFSVPSEQAFTIHVQSFGFKYGVPIDADLVFDVRFLPNPHYVDRMREKTGLDQEVSDYVFKWTETKKFLEKLLDLLLYMLPQYKREGKSQLIIGIGCTGGKHRSVALAEYIAGQLAGDYFTHVTHRDIGKGKVLPS